MRRTKPILDIACCPVLAFQAVERKHALARAAEEDAAPSGSLRGGKNRKNGAPSNKEEAAAQKKPGAVGATDFATAIANVLLEVRDTFRES
jgi:hypothetical protein